VEEHLPSLVSEFQIASATQALPPSGIAPATLSSHGCDQVTRSVDSHTTRLRLALFMESSHDCPQPMHRSVAMIQYLSPPGALTSAGSRTPRAPTVERRAIPPPLR
jgi:hypothetical protein